jgi:AbrB family looped-hinge helix DNA binding protein
MGNLIGMGITMGKIELDDRGRITIPAHIREKLALKSGDKLSLRIDSDKSITLRKAPSLNELEKALIGSITVPSSEKITVESIKDIWKTNPKA